MYTSLITVSMYNSANVLLTYLLHSNQHTHTHTCNHVHRQIQLSSLERWQLYIFTFGISCYPLGGVFTKSPWQNWTRYNKWKLNESSSSAVMVVAPATVSTVIQCHIQPIMMQNAPKSTDYNEISGTKAPQTSILGRDLATTLQTAY